MIAAESHGDGPFCFARRTGAFGFKNDLSMRQRLPILFIALAANVVHAADTAEPILEPAMVHIAPGSFNMGSDSYPAEKPLHQVSIGYAFEIGKTEITQGQWKAVMGENPSSFSQCGDNCPVENVSWTDANLFIQRLNQKTGKTYRLPSEAEWEYACRAGKNDEYCGGNDVGMVAWYISNSNGQTRPVTQKMPNAWGLYGMSGNVYEWTQDCWKNDSQDAPADGSARESNNCRDRVIRGGSWSSDLTSLRAANRYYDSIGYRLEYVGFRVARTLP